MSFLNILLIGGTLAFSLPLLIHLLNRSRFETVDWGAMHLLEAALQSNSRKLQWQSWLLLLIRCLIPIIFGLCLARPVLTAFKVAGAQGKRAIGLLVDDTFSMNQFSGAKSFLDQAKSHSEQLTKTYPDSQWYLHAAGGQGGDILSGTTTDGEFVRRTVDKIDGLAGDSRTLSAITSLVEAVSSSTAAAKHVIILSDFQKSSWEDVPDAEVQLLRQKLSNGESRVQLTLLRSSAVPANLPADNLSISLDPPGSGVLTTGEVIPVLATVFNHGTQPQEDVTVQFVADGVALSQERLTIDAESSSRVQFACSFKQSGFHNVSVQIKVPEDIESLDLENDNIAVSTFNILEPLEVLVVDGQPSKGLASQSGYLQAALQPFMGSAVATQFDSPFRIKVIQPNDLRSVKLSSFDIIAVCGVTRLTSTNAADLQDFVTKGGGLLVFPSSKMDAKALNRHLGDETDLLPAEYLTFTPIQKTGIRSQELQQKQLQIFNSNSAGDLSTVEINAMWKMRIRPSAQETAETIFEVDLAAEDQYSALWISRKLGAGTVIQSAISLTEVHSNLPRRPVFVPLVRRLLILVANKPTVTTNIPSTSSITFDLSDSETTETTQLPTAIEVITPNGQVQKIETLNEEKVTLSSTTQPGLYEVKAGESPIRPRQFAVQASKAESELDFLSDEELQELAEKLGGSAQTSVEAFSEQELVSRNGKEIWRWFLIALLIFLFAESLLCNRISRGAG